MVELAALLAETSGLDQVFPCNSGAEANEGAIKLARKWGSRHRDGAFEIITMHGSFHGRTLATMAASGKPGWDALFEPKVPGFRKVPLSDLEAVTGAISPRTVAVMLEPIQGEAGVVVASDDYLCALRALTRERGILMILDEVQTGLGRTGGLFAHQAEGIAPDVLVLAKALGGGIAPTAATVTRADLHQQAYGAMQRFDLHGSTFAGNALACVAALETLAILDDEKLAQNSATRGEQLLDGLRRRLAGHPLVRDIRGCGLLVGIELGIADSRLLARVVPDQLRETFAGILGQWFAMQLLERQILCQPAAHRWNVVKLEPPLTVQAVHIDRVVEAVADVLDSGRDVARLVRDITARLGRQALKGWAF